MKIAAATGFAILSLAVADAQTPRATARVRGRVVAAATGRPLVRATVQLRSVDNQNIYRILGLPAGDYLAAAVPALSLPVEGEWDPAFLEKVRPWATGFKLFEGQTLSLNFTLIE